MEIKTVINNIKRILFEIGFILLCFVNRVKADEDFEDLEDSSNYTTVKVAPDLVKGEKTWKSLPIANATNDILNLLYYALFVVACAVIIVAGLKLFYLIYKGEADWENIKKEFGSRNKIKHSVETVLWVVGGLVAVNIIFNYAHWGI
jgi:hypothetical protein